MPGGCLSAVRPIWSRSIPTRRGGSIPTRSALNRRTLRSTAARCRAASSARSLTAARFSRGNERGENNHCEERGDKAISAVMNVVAAALLAYLLGSIPFGLLLTRLAGIGDIRHIGSGNIGATNVLRTGSKALAAVTLVCDVGKGVAAVLIGAVWGVEAALAASVAVILGHMFPIWLRFRGGKGVATALGVLLVLAWPVGVIAALLWLPAAPSSPFFAVSAA